MPHWLARSAFPLAWLTLLGFVTWLAMHSWFLYFPYLLCLPPLLVVASVPLFFPWKLGDRRLHIAFVILGTIWLLTLPFIAWNTEQELLRDASSIRTGMDSEQVLSHMSTYPSNQHNDLARNYDLVLVFFCADDACGGTVVNVNFRDGRVVNVEPNLD